MASLLKYNPGSSTFWVTDGRDAIEFIYGTGDYAKFGPRTELRLVLLDLKLKTAYGFEVLKKIRSEESTKALPVVILTASLKQEDREQSIQLGANAFLVKPMKSEQFAKQISDFATTFLGDDQVQTPTL